MVAAIVVNTDSRAAMYQDEFLGRSVAAWAERGLSISLMTAGEARSRLRRCTCEEEHMDAMRRIADVRESLARDKHAAVLRDEGLSFAEIGARIGVSKSYARYCAMRGQRRIETVSGD